MRNSTAIDKFFYLFAALLLLVAYVAGLFVPLMDNDACRHATIALRMFQDDSFLSLIDRGELCLDGPHLPYWLMACTFKLIGVSVFGYRISSFLFTLLALWSTYRLGRMFLTRRVASIAVAILSTMFAFQLANTDVQVDAILLGSVVFALWQGVRCIDRGAWCSAVWAGLGLAMAYGTTGVIGIAVPCMSYVFFLLGMRRWSALFRWQTLVLVASFVLFSLPFFYAYYLQFDLHPELLVRGATGLSGVCSLLSGPVAGCMGGEMSTMMADDHLFFLYTLLLALLPWSGLFYLMIFRSIKTYDGALALNWITLPTIALTMLAFSLSDLKSPHYINILFPMMALFMADQISRMVDTRWERCLAVLQKCIYLLLYVVIAVIGLWVFPFESHAVKIGFIVVLAIFLLWMLCSRLSIRPMVLHGVFVAAVLFAFLNLYFYPKLLTYQAGTVLSYRVNHAEEVFEYSIDPDAIEQYSTKYSYSMSMGLGRVMTNYYDPDEVGRPRFPSSVKYLMVDHDALNKLIYNNVVFDVMTQSIDYHITMLTPKFLNPETRAEELSLVYLLRLY